MPNSGSLSTDDDDDDELSILFLPIQISCVFFLVSLKPL